MFPLPSGIVELGFDDFLLALDLLLCSVLLSFGATMTSVLVWRIAYSQAGFNIPEMQEEIDINYIINE
jgi:hypothetical protein